MIVVTHYRISTDINGKERGKQANAVDDPLTAMVIVFARIVIAPAEKGATYTTSGDVIIGCGIKADKGFPGASHDKVLFAIVFADDMDSGCHLSNQSVCPYCPSRSYTVYFNDRYLRRREIVENI